MKEDLTYIAGIIDHSGSMFSISSDTAGGWAAYLEAQAKEPGEAKVMLAEFDSVYNLVYPLTPIADVPAYNLVPRGSTALLDAIGKTVTDLGAQLAALDEADRPGKVVVVILTDGMENASREWFPAGIKALIKQQTDVYKWEFIFLGANIDAVSTANDLGIARGSALDYGANSDGVAVAFAAASNYTATTRSGLAANFSDTDRKAAKDTV